MKKILTIIIAGIMAFSLAACSGAPANVVHVDRYLAAAVGGDGELVDAAIIHPQNASATVNGITVTARQAVADKHTMYILLTVTATPDMEFTYNDGFDIYGSGNFHWTTVSEDKNTMFVVVGNDSEEGIEKGTASVSLWDLKTYGADGKEKVYKGNWNLQFDYEVADVTRRYTSEEIVKADGVELKFNYIDISPFGIYLSFGLADGSINPQDDWDYDTPDMDVILKDGTEVGVTRSLGSAEFGGTREDFNYYRSGKLVVAVDPENVKAISYDGQIVELK